MKQDKDWFEEETEDEDEYILSASDENDSVKGKNTSEPKSNNVKEKDCKIAANLSCCAENGLSFRESNKIHENSPQLRLDSMATKLTKYSISILILN